MYVAKEQQPLDENTKTLDVDKNNLDLSDALSEEGAKIQ